MFTVYTHTLSALFNLFGRETPVILSYKGCNVLNFESICIIEIIIAPCVFKGVRRVANL